MPSRNAPEIFIEPNSPNRPTDRQERRVKVAGAHCPRAKHVAASQDDGEKWHRQIARVDEHSHGVAHERGGFRRRRIGKRMLRLGQVPGKHLVCDGGDRCS